ncbi:MAG: Seryl-tRNA synthetase [Candidatus Magnetoglobus multicellularis str. Araruama]|uniref:Serine--tRNA ligase n=1 Tax=Candidatus Magnetoglobus multicellularis str. Araruama TaxID=890399 RepID=A0A1V1PI20_9BACT|nr:MAG: Seryl-tRNA synthetase [Candidatus Magnetoglobus multicellularis str. Araruama]
MLDIKFIRQNIETVKQSIAQRGGDKSIDLDSLIQTDTHYRNILTEIESFRSKRNDVSGQIAKMKRNGEDTSALTLEMRDVSRQIKDMESKLSKYNDTIKKVLLEIPNVPHSSVPQGQNDSQNIEIKTIGTPPSFEFQPKAHWTLGENLKILDFERASKITGARFPLYFREGARMERALIQFMLDIHIKEHGYIETLPPFIVNRTTMTGTGQLPKFNEDLFKIENLDYFLIPTAEVPVTNIFRDEILSDKDLPMYYTAFTPCFRSEAGSYGKDTRGLIRQHQFNKVELVKFVHPDNSYDELEKLLSNAETILQRLELPYRVVNLCTGDLGFSATKTYDIEVWMPAQNKYREISSCSNFESFQARRANIRFKEEGKKGTQFVHTLNGSGLAVGRTFSAILENFQQENGVIVIPEALRPYMDGMDSIG